MYKDLEIVNKENHKNQSVREIKDFSYAKNIMNAPITVAEFFEACKNYPIFFAKDKDKVVLLKFVAGRYFEIFFPASDIC